ncbi:hypothetical protein RSc3422 [Ralstonia pseudosolanacearum GMI1000]|uniref:Uncharacterized protein n=1 Tax=Ralstonia nicotianae (strain ATCC BAA-1114 / GMI1000) TaxID=267608 RepID=Q8XTX4_RALN1|nr:hypothetical protein RSc3422 [Ralstonia pseudosolanacearum GMI1000]
MDSTGQLLWSSCDGKAEQSCVFDIARGHVDNDSRIRISYGVQ